MKARPETWVELCCGGAAATLRLLAARAGDPPARYMGGKRRYSSAVVAALGLRPGVGAGRIVLCDAGAWARAWQVLTVPSLALAAAAHLERWHRAGWTGTELWRRLNDLGQPEDPAEWTAAFVCVQDANFRARPVAAKGDGSWGTHGPMLQCAEAVAGGARHPPLPEFLAPRLRRLAALPWPARVDVVHGDARSVEPIPGAVVYLDPPYAGTTGYDAGLTRAEVAALARAWADAGCHVAVSEGEPLAELADWHHAEITAAHSGQPRVFSKSAAEWLTINRPAYYRPPAQTAMMGL